MRARLVYLHGFASSPRSSKARFFAERAAAAGIDFACPDLNEPDFSRLTVTRMIADTDRAIDAATGPVTLTGSSLGAFVAVHAAAGRAMRRGSAAPIASLILLAPALDLREGLEEELGTEKMQAWESSGRLPVFHYADNAMRELDWTFMLDLRQYDSGQVALALPTLIYQGRSDELVRADRVERWAHGRANTTLKLVDDGHQLLAHLEPMWADVLKAVKGAR